MGLTLFAKREHLRMNPGQLRAKRLKYLLAKLPPIDRLIFFWYAYHEKLFYFKESQLKKLVYVKLQSKWGLDKTQCIS